MLFNAYVPPVNTNEELGKTMTDYNQVKNTADVYHITTKDVKENLVPLDQKTGKLDKQKKETLDGPNQVEVSGPDIIYKDAPNASVFTGTPGESVWRTNSNIGLSLDPNGPFTNYILTLPSSGDGTFYVDGLSTGDTSIKGSQSPEKFITVEEGTPITLDHFDVLTKDGQPVLSWETASETNNDHFEIERSFDGMNFETIDTIDSKAKNGTSREKLEYSYTDTSDDLSGTVYYRLKQVDKDGQSETFDAKTVVIENPDLAPTLSPNPVTNGQVTLKTFNKNQDKYRIVNMQGQTVADGDLILGQNDIQLPSLPAGEYVVQIEGSNKALKLMVQ